MANPNTAVRSLIQKESVNTFLSQIIVPHVPPLFTFEFVNKGVFGNVFSIDVDISIENPFETFWVTPDRRIVTTSNNLYLSSPDPKHRFCCKLVLTETPDQANSFVTECMKQSDIYAKTNNLNAVCLPLFFCGVFSDIPGDSVSMFIKLLLSVTDIKYESSPQFGISFMPYTVNDLESYNLDGLPASLQYFTTSESILRNYEDIIKTINMWVDYTKSPPFQNYPNDQTIIEMFQTNTPIYSYVLVISLIMRLYFAGYCHGDLHLGNIVVYPTPSGMIKGNKDASLPDTYFYPSLLLIDTGYSFRHGHDTSPGRIETYEHFRTFLQNIITAIIPRTGLDMYKHEYYVWVPRIFADITKDGWVINENRCKFIFHLFQRFETFRTTFEVQQSDVAKEIAPDMIEAIIDGNATAIASVDAYIASIPGGTPAEQLHKFNIHGGRRRRIYNAIKRKQTKNTKKHSRNRNRSLTRSRSRSRRRRGPTKLK
jgi:hypothetical protein